VSDANVMLGKLRPEFFPRVFGPGQDEPLDADVVRERFEAVTSQINAAYVHHHRAPNFQKHSTTLHILVPLLTTFYPLY
jgi:N-methylhydantoinase A/oxoprolinase/acetone carboxylase beta subunit